METTIVGLYGGVYIHIYGWVYVRVILAILLNTGPIIWRDAGVVPCSSSVLFRRSNKQDAEISSHRIIEATLTGPTHMSYSLNS